MGVISWIVLKEDWSFALSCGKKSLEILERYPDSPYEGQTMWNCYGFCLCWNEPLRATRQQLHYAYKSSMRHGDTETAMWVLATYQVTDPYVLGRRLDTTVKKLPQLISHIEEYQRSEPATMVKMLFQLFLILKQDTAKDAQLKGSVFDDEKDL